MNPQNLELDPEDRSWPGRAEAALKFGAGKLTFAGMQRPSFGARREGLLMAGRASSAGHSQRQRRYPKRAVGGERRLIFTSRPLGTEVWPVAHDPFPSVGSSEPRSSGAPQCLRSCSIAKGALASIAGAVPI